MQKYLENGFCEMTQDEMIDTDGGWFTLSILIIGTYHIYKYKLKPHKA